MQVDEAFQAPASKRMKLSHARPALHIEVSLQTTSVLTPEQVNDDLVPRIRLLAQSIGAVQTLELGCFYLDTDADEYLKEHVDYARISDLDPPLLPYVITEATQFQVHAFRLEEDDGAADTEETPDGGTVNACDIMLLPNTHLDGLWESLIYDDDMKNSLLNYVSTIMLYSDQGVDPNIISFNRVALLHGPPGTGKTSLCKALAQKIAIRFADRYHSGTLIEINAHSLFSKWFSESGKLVQGMFAKVKEYAEDQNSFVCVLVDEVESLTSARKAAANGTEPSDAIRAVNAVLTQLDQLRNKPNVLILTTSNITGAIDVAFVDRADIKQFIGPPGLSARYAILKSCILELQKCEILADKCIFQEAHGVRSPSDDGSKRATDLLLDCAKRSEGMSGRALRKLPALAHAMFNSVESTEKFLESLIRAIEVETENRTLLYDAK